MTRPDKEGIPGVVPCVLAAVCALNCTVYGIYSAIVQKVKAQKQNTVGLRAQFSSGKHV